MITSLPYDQRRRTGDYILGLWEPVMAPAKRKRPDRSYSTDSNDGQRPSPHRPGNANLGQHGREMEGRPRGGGDGGRGRGRGGRGRGGMGRGENRRNTNNAPKSFGPSGAKASRKNAI